MLKAIAPFNEVNITNRVLKRLKLGKNVYFERCDDVSNTDTNWTSSRARRKGGKVEDTKSQTSEHK